MLINCLIVAAIFGLVPILEKYILKSIHVETMMILSGILYGLAAILFGAFFWKDSLIDDVAKMTPLLWFLVSVAAVLVLIVANYIYLSVIRDHTTAIVTAITASYPLFTVVAGLLLFGEMITWSQFAGVLLVIGGIFLLHRE